MTERTIEQAIIALPQMYLTQFSEEEKQALTTAIECLQSTLERVRENKPLKKQEMIELIGEPVWDNSCHDWVIVRGYEQGEILFRDSWTTYEPDTFYRYKVE